MVTRAMTRQRSACGSQKMPRMMRSWTIHLQCIVKPADYSSCLRYVHREVSPRITVGASSVHCHLNRILRVYRSVFLMQVVPAAEYKLKWTDPDEVALVKFLVEEKGYVFSLLQNEHYLWHMRALYAIQHLP